MGCQPVEPETGLAAAEMRVVLAEGLALPGSIAVGNAGQVDVGVGISSDQIEDIAAAATDLVNGVTLPTLAIRRALELAIKVPGSSQRPCRRA